MNPVLQANSAVPVAAWRKKAKDALTAHDMTPETWRDLVAGLVEFFGEEAQEPQHAMDKTGEFEHEIVLQTRGDFDWRGLIHHMHRLGGWGASRDIIAIDSDDKPVKFNWDGDGADKIVNVTIDGANILTRKELAEDRAIALDSVRTEDIDGRMRVAVMNISKACVNPYKGSEIPGSEAMGLDPDRVYYLYRDPEELAKAAASSNGVQILRKHIPVNAEDHQPWDTVGATGTDGKFEHPYLQNSGSIWAADDIAGIKSGKKKQVSLGYHYRPDMTPGEAEGIPFDGIMRDIVVNHLALVEDGRAGPDVVVADEAPNAGAWRAVEQALLTI